MLFLVYSCIPARQRTDICNTRCSILSRLAFSTPAFLQHGAAFSCPACSRVAFSASPSSRGLGPQCSGHGLQVELVERESSKAMFVARNSNCLTLHCVRNVTLHFACFIQLSLSVTCFILDLCRYMYVAVCLR